jgi:hypothetical protein
MRTIFIIPLMAAFSIVATSAMAGDVISCSRNIEGPPPPPPHHGKPPTPPEDGPKADEDSAPPPPKPHASAPGVDDKLHCNHDGNKMERSLSELATDGWQLQTAVPEPGSITFYLIK